VTLVERLLSFMKQSRRGSTDPMRHSHPICQLRALVCFVIFKIGRVRSIQCDAKILSNLILSNFWRFGANQVYNFSFLLALIYYFDSGGK